MLRYGNIINVSNGNSRTLLPRNLTLKNNSNNLNIINNTQTTQNNVLSINKLNINDITSNNTIINDVLQIESNSTNYNNNNYKTINKIYVASGVTNNNNIIFRFKSVSTNFFSGVLLGTTYGKLNNEVVSTQIYNINIWNIDNINIGFNSLNPININNSDWYINNIILVSSSDGTYDLELNCTGSSNGLDVIWGFKLDIVQI